MKIEWGKLTEEQCAAIMREAAQYLTEEVLFETVASVLTKTQKEELGEEWFNIDKGNS